MFPWAEPENQSAQVQREIYAAGLKSQVEQRQQAARTAKLAAIAAEKADDADAAADAISEARSDARDRS